jgi:hypothetical protein
MREVSPSKEWSYYSKDVVECLKMYNNTMYDMFGMPYIFDGIARLVGEYMRRQPSENFGCSPVTLLMDALQWSASESQKNGCNTTCTENLCSKHLEVIQETKEANETNNQ